MASLWLSNSGSKDTTQHTSPCEMRSGDENETRSTRGNVQCRRWF
jgi:hypothetical protein